MDKLLNISKYSRLDNILRYVLCLILLAAPFFRGTYLENHLFPFLTVIPLLFILFLYEQYRNRDQEFFNSPLDWAMLALLLAYVLSLTNAVNTRLAIIGVMKITAYVMIFWMCFRAARQSTGVRTIITTCYTSGLGMAIFGLLVYCGVINYPYVQAGDRIASTLEYANTLGIYMAVIFFLGWGLLLSTKNIAWRGILAAGNTLLLMALLGSLSRGTWLLYPIAGLLYIFLQAKGQRLAALFSWLSSLIPGLLLGRLFLAAPSGSGAIIYILAGMVFAAGVQIGLDYLYLRLKQNDKLPGKKLSRTVIAAFLVLMLAGALTSSSFKSFFTQGAIARLTQISLQDQNVQLRFEFSRNALQIIKDYPITGVGAGGWEALYHKYALHLYWSVTAHNYPLQTWLESGTIGLLALIAIWVLFLGHLWRVWRSSLDNKRAFALFWSAALACLLLAAHSVIDWDMSFSSVAFLLFGLMGTVKAWSVAIPETRNSVPAKAKKRAEKKFHWKREFLAGISIGVIVGLTLTVFSACLWSASNSFNTAKKVMNQDPNRALTLFNQATSLDSLNAAYWNQTANFWEAVFIADKSSQAYQQMMNSCQKAVELEPYNIKILNNANRIYIGMGDYDKALNLTELLIRANPQDPAAYENLAINQVLKGLQYLESGDVAKAKAVWQQSLLVKDRVPLQMDFPVVGLNLTSGQALLLLGERVQGEQYLVAMLNSSAEPVSQWYGTVQQRNDEVHAYRNQSRIWLAAWLETSGKTDEAQSLLAQVTDSSDPNIIRTQVERVKGWLQKAGITN